MNVGFSRYQEGGAAQVDDNAAMMMEEVVVQVGSGEEAAWLLWNPC